MEDIYSAKQCACIADTFRIEQCTLVIFYSPLSPTMAREIEKEIS